MAVSFTVKVIPCSNSLRFEIDKNGIIKCYLKSPAEDGRANRELIKELSKALNLAKESIEIVIGLTQRKKVIKIYADLSIESICKALGLEYQPHFF